MSQPRVLIFGAGAVGTYYMYLLQQAGCQVAAVCRSNYRAAKHDGFSLDSGASSRNLLIRPYCLFQSNSSKVELQGQIFDYVLVTTKAFPDTSPSTAELIRPYVSLGITSIALLQNGIGIEEEFEAMYSNNPILSCIVNLHAVRTSPVHVYIYADQHLEIGPSSINKEGGQEQAVRSAEALCVLIRRGGGLSSIYRDMQPRRWLKLLINATWNPICALTQLDDSSFLKSSSLAPGYVKEAMGEVVGVAQALGYSEVTQTKANDRLERVLNRIDAAGYETSMLADVRHKRPMEVEAILGNVIRIAGKHGVAVKQLEALYALLSGLDDAIQRS